MKCPNCSHQFRLGELLDTQYAPWQVIEDPLANVSLNRVRVAADADQASAAGWDGDTEPLPVETQLAIEHRVEQLEEGLHLNSGAASQGVDWSGFKTGSHDHHPRRRSNQSGGLKSTLQVILGGAAAIPVSLLLIWYVLGKDVAGAGPKVARYLPWIVPRQFHGDSGLASPPPKSRNDGSARQSNGFRNFDDVLTPDGKGYRESLPAPEFPTATDMPEPLPSSLDKVESSPETSKAPSTKEPEVPSNAEPNGKTTDGGGTGVLRQQPSLPSDRELNIGSGSPKDPVPALLALLQQTRQHVTAWRPSSDQVTELGSDSAKSLESLAIFKELSSIGAAHAALPDGAGSEAALQELVKDLGRQIKRQAELVEQLQIIAETEIQASLPSPGQGLALVCTLDEAQEQDNHWRINVTDGPLLSRNFPPVIIPKRLGPKPNAGDRRLFIGDLISPTTDAKQPQPASEAREPDGLLFRVAFMIVL